MEFEQIMGRLNANGYYLFQQVRESLMNSIRNIIRKIDKDIPFDAAEKKKEKKKFEKEYNDKNLTKTWDRLLKEEKITLDQHNNMFAYWENVQKIKKEDEKWFKKQMISFIKFDPIYKNFLSKIKGIGHILSANLIAEFGNCSTYNTVSKLWAHTGNSVINGVAPKRKKGATINYSPKLKTLTWMISDCLMKQNKGIYRKIYDTEKEKQANRTYDVGYLFEQYGKPYKEEDTKLSKGHRHNRALRKTRKLFLSHYWEAGRELYGLPIERIYVEGVLNHNHIIHWREALEIEGTYTPQVRSKKKDEKKEK